MRRGCALVPERGILCSVDAQAPHLMQRRYAPMCERLMVFGADVRALQLGGANAN
jgi:hypothetical protein